MKILNKIIICITIIFLIIFIIYGYVLINNNYNNNFFDNNPPEITLLITASSVSSDLSSYSLEYTFSKGQVVYVYQEYTNISHNSISNFYLNISIVYEDGVVYGFVEDTVTKPEKSCFYYFNTNSSWPTGFYVVTSSIVDNISNRNTSNVVTFYLM